MKILITGSSGLVGNSCARLFASKGWEVVGLDNHQRAKMFGVEQAIPAIDADIRNRAELMWIFEENRFDAVIHAAAQPSHDYSTTHIHEDFEINALGSLNLLELAHRYCPDAPFVFVSTDKVYGENMEGHEPFDEHLGLDFAGHRSFFGCSKTAADIYAQEFANEFGMKIGIFRPGCVTGKNHAGAELHGFLAYLAKCIKEGKTYKIFGDGNTVRDQIHADDLAEAFYRFIEDPKPGVYNIGGGMERAVSISQAIARIEWLAKKQAVIEHHPERLGDRRWDVHDVSKFRTAYPGWDYKYSLDDIFKDLCTN